MLKNKFTYLALSIILSLIACKQIPISETKTALTFTSLTCDSQINPIAIESKQPLFSWTVKANGFNRAQTAYQILVASSADLLNETDADLWNSKQVKNAQSIHIKYSGKELLPMNKYFWKVRIWDEENKQSAWSSIQNFEMGLVKESSWGAAKWISLNKDTRTSQHRFRAYKTGKMKAPQMVTSQPMGNGFYGQNISWKRDLESEKDLSYGYDARFEINGWNKTGYDDAEWQSAKSISPKLKKISAQQMPPMQKFLASLPSLIKIP